MLMEKYRKHYEDEKNLQMSMYSNHPRNYSHNRVKNIVMKEIANLAPSSLLDAGCAEGFYTRDSAGNGVFSVGADVALSKLYNAKCNFDGDGLYLCADLQRLPFPDDSFDMVIALEVLEHVPEYKIAFREIFRVSGKYVVLSVPVGVSEGAGHISFFHKNDFKSWADRYKLIRCYGILTRFMLFRRTISLMSFKFHKYIEFLDSIFCSLPYFKYTGTHIVLVFEKSGEVIS